MARISVEELYRGENAGAKYESGGIMGAVTKEMLTRGVPEGYDEQTWFEMLIVKFTLETAEKMKIEGDSVSAMTGVGALSSYVTERNSIRI
ncbi:MAG: hypothetical protein J1F28_05670 [Oscillospiraceae bacterium]|nr:hypothetical protein [Oscillospiraceae bacterium]